MDSFAARLDAAQYHHHRIAMLSLETELSLDDAYRIQRAVVALRLSRGERRVGVKMGLTTEAKLRQLRGARPVYGHLTDAMQVEDGGHLSLQTMAEPRVEPEIAFIMGRELHGAESMEEAWNAVAGVCPALEIVYNRYADFRFHLADLVADNVAAAYFVLGPQIEPHHSPPLDNLAMELHVDGRIVRTATSASVYGHPLRSLQLQAQMLAEHGEALRPGDVVLSGNPTDSVYLQPGCLIEAHIERLGRASLHTVS